jgi:diguanylate cyclase (GGDEF)-like protein
MMQLFSFDRLKSNGWRPGIAFKLYCVAGLSAIAVAVLSISAYHFARVTQAAARSVYHQGFPGLESSTRLQTLLEQYRRIVETAPAEVDRTRLKVSERAMVQRGEQLSALIKDLNDHQSDPVSDSIEKQFAQKLPQLLDLGRKVLFYAYNFAQDKSLEYAAQHAKVADEVQGLIQTYRDHRMKIADSAVLILFDSAEALIIWILASAIAAFILIGPLGLTITRGVLSRLARITDYMTRLARHGRIEEVPSGSDQDEVGDMARAVEVFKGDAVELLESKAQLESVIVQLDVALNNMTHGLCMFNAEKRLIVCNARYGEMFGLPRELTKPGTPLQSILDFRREHGSLAPSPEAAPSKAPFGAAGQATTVIEELPHGRVIAISRQPMPDGGWVAVYEDVTERRRAEGRIAHIAKHDQLTGLPNRVLFREQLDDALRVSQPDAKFALLCLDLDGFKGVNDSLGHPVGDQMLKIVGERLLKCLAPKDLVARLGGDEFAIIQAGIEHAEDSGEMARAIIEAVSAPYLIEDNQIIIDASIGIAIAPQDGQDADVLLRNADMAMYCAKADGRGSYRFFTPAMRANIEAKHSLELELRQALSNGELDVYYQPVVDGRGAVRSFEALARWFHPKIGEILPSRFIPLAEETGLISALGEWILRTACVTAAKWPDDVNIAVNLSSIQFRNGNIVQTIVNALSNSGLAASRLEIEITETVFLENNSNTISMLHQLRQLGVRIVMDDFGTGYSSLSYLRSFPFDKLKIDQSFVEGLGKAEDSLAIVRAIVMLAKSLRIGVVAEGVETAEQFRILRLEGCNEFQGFFLSRPEPAGQIDRALTRCGERIRLAA